MHGTAGGLFSFFILFTAKLLMKLSLLHKRCNFMYLILLHEIHTEGIFYVIR